MASSRTIGIGSSSYSGTWIDVERNVELWCTYILMRDEEEKSKKEASKVTQTMKQSNTAHPRQVTFQKNNELPWVGLEPTAQGAGFPNTYTVVYVPASEQKNGERLDRMSSLSPSISMQH